jgi:methylated-DNA-protein-cysteine methyltransferase-like protein
MNRTIKDSHRLLLPLGSGRTPVRSARDVEANAAVQAIWNAVAMIPRGKVLTYAEVARAAGFPGRARQAGYALRMMPADLHLPWHRVMGAGGRIVFPKASAHYREQARRLRSEGVAVKDGRVARSALMASDPDIVGENRWR